MQEKSFLWQIYRGGKEDGYYKITNFILCQFAEGTQKVLIKTKRVFMENILKMFSFFSLLKRFIYSPPFYISSFIPDNCNEALAVKLEPVRVNVFCVEVLVVVFSNVKVAGSTFKVGVGVGVPQSGVEW